jgi:hypothetical protein
MTITGKSGCVIVVAIILVGIGLVFGLGGFVSLGSSRNHDYSAVVTAIVAIVLGVFGVLILLGKPSYNVTIVSSAGETQALNSRDQEYIQKIVKSINEAIVRH